MFNFTMSFHVKWVNAVMVIQALKVQQTKLINQ